MPGSEEPRGSARVELPEGGAETDEATGACLSLKSPRVECHSGENDSLPPTCILKSDEIRMVRGCESRVNVNFRGKVSKNTWNWRAGSVRTQGPNRFMLQG